MRDYLLYGLYGLIGLLVLSAIALKVFQPVQMVPRIRLVPGFSLHWFCWQLSWESRFRQALSPDVLVFRNLPVLKSS